MTYLYETGDVYIYIFYKDVINIFSRTRNIDLLLYFSNKIYVK